MVAAGSRYWFLGVWFLSAVLTAVVPPGARADLFVTTIDNNMGLGTVMQYDENTGAFLNDFLSLSGMSGNIGDPRGVLFGPDGNLYVAVDNNSFQGVLRYDSTGNFIDNFLTGGVELDEPHGIIFGPDGNLYVSSNGTSSVERYDGKTGLLIDDFIPSGSGGLDGPGGLVFGPDGNLYVGSSGSVGTGIVGVLRFNGATGAFMDVFASDSLTTVEGIVFGPDGNLYVSGYTTVNRYDGTTGQLMDILDPSNNAGLGGPYGILFGPDGNLYVGDLDQGGVRRYNGTTGDFIDAFINRDTAGQVTYITFTKTDPQTLNYKR